MLKNSTIRLVLGIACAMAITGAWAAGDHGGTQGKAPSGAITDSRELTKDEEIGRAHV